MQKRTRTRARTFALSLAAVASLLLGGCDEDQTRTEGQKNCTGKCPGAQVCDTNVGTCFCEVGVNGATCSRDTDCSAGETCGNPSCQCVPSGTGGTSGKGGAGGEGAGGTGATSGSGGTGATSAGFPPHTTNCATDAKGCLTADTNGCEIVLDEPATASTTTLQIEGGITVGGTTSDVTAYGFGEDLQYENDGYRASLNYSVMASDGGRIRAVLRDPNYMTLAEKNWAGADGVYPFKMTVSFDKTQENTALQVDGEGSPATAIFSDRMGPPVGTQTVVTVKEGYICGIVSTQF